MTVIAHSLTGESETIRCAQTLAPLIKPPLKLYFSGDIGAGKSCFIRALLHAKGVRQRIKSPTFSIIETYQLQEDTFVHIDLYRVADEEELAYLGLEEYDTPSSVFLIEWPEKVQSLSLPDIKIELSSIDFGDKRKIVLQSISQQGENVLQLFQHA